MIKSRVGCFGGKGLRLVQNPAFLGLGQKETAKVGDGGRVNARGAPLNMGSEICMWGLDELSYSWDSISSEGQEGKRSRTSLERCIGKRRTSI